MITNIMVPYFRTSNDMGNYLGTCSRVLVFWLSGVGLEVGKGYFKAPCLGHGG